MFRGIITILSALTFSASLALADDDLQVLWEEPYDFSSLTGGFADYGPYYTQDDFTLATDSLLQAVECWTFYYPDDSDNHPKPFYVRLRYDHYGMPGGYYITSYAYDVEETYTGDVYMGRYPVYHYLLNLEDTLGIDGGTPFWLEIYSQTENFQWGARNTGNLYFMWNEQPYSAFFRLLGTPLDTDVQTATWGEIKATYSD
jgi:hypothetical protein